MSTGLLGAPTKRREDNKLLRGHGRYIDDIKLSGEVAAVFVRSPYAHATITSIDTSQAEQLPGVHAIYTYEHVQHLGPLLSLVPLGKQRPLLANGVVKHAGEPVAMVLADNRYLAQDGADAVIVHYEQQQPILDVEFAASDVQRVHEDLPSNIINTIEAGDAAAVQKAREGHDVVIVTQRLVNQRVLPLALEPRAALADVNESITLWSPTQIPFGLAAAVSKIFGLPFNQVRVIAPDIGGGFGSKLNVYTEEILVCFASRALGRPVRWIETRRENMVTTSHGRDWVTTCTMIASRDGKILGYDVDGVADMGAYSQCFTAGIPGLGQMAASGGYNIPAIHFKIRCVVTHKMSTDSCRGAGRPEAIYCLERMVDILARELGRDPTEIRLKNFWQPEQFPVVNGFGLSMDSGNYPSVFRKLLDNARFSTLRQEQKEARKQGRYLGIGTCFFVEPGGLSPSFVPGLSFSNFGLPSTLTEVASVRVNPEGSVSVFTGSSPSGQGHETAWSQIIGEVLTIPMEIIQVLHGDTQGTPIGMGSFGSRSAAVGGTAVLQACEKIKAKAIAIASLVLKVAAEQVTLEDGYAVCKSDTSVKMSWKEIAAVAYQRQLLPESLDIGLETTVYVDPPGLVWTNGAHLAQVEVYPDTGVIEVLRYITVDDCGNMINPLIVEGQIHGGIAQGFGQAMQEEVLFGENGQLLSDSLETYHIPIAENLPDFELDHLTTPTSMNPLGAKGVGEGGAIAAPPALVNAVLDALSPLNVHHVDMPMRPHYIWNAIQQAKGAEHYVSSTL